MISETLRSSYLNQLERIFLRPRSELKRLVSPLFTGYYHLAIQNPKEIKKSQNYAKYLFDTLNAEGKEILDVGCGYGLFSLFFRLFGASEVTGIDSWGEMVNASNKLLSLLSPNLTRIKFVSGDATHASGFADGSFDIIFCMEAVSHISNSDLFFKEAHRLLRTGGILFVSDGNNKLNPYSVYKSIKAGRKKEYRGTHLPEYRVNKPSFIDIRENIIKSGFPYLDKKEIKFLVHKTRCMTQSEIYEAVNRYQQRRPLKTKPLFEYCDPISGQYEEKLFNPVKLKTYLKGLGFAAKEYPYFGKFSRESYGIAAWMSRIPYSVVLSRAFYVIAQKSG